MSVVAGVDVDVDVSSVVRGRLEVFAGEVLAEATNRPVQMVNGGLYLRGLIEQGPRKSLEPLVERLGEEGDYHSMQQFLADSPWDPVLVVRAVAERVVGEIELEAWVLDDTGFPKDGKDSRGVKRQYSGTLGKTGNCQIGVSLHAVGGKGTVPLGWELYLPQEWCEDPERRHKAKIPPRLFSRPSPSSGWIWRCARRAGRSSGHRCWVTAPTATTPSFVTSCMMAGCNTCSRFRRRRPCSRQRRSFRCPSKEPEGAGDPVGVSDGLCRHVLTFGLGGPAPRGRPSRLVREEHHAYRCTHERCRAGRFVASWRRAVG